MKHMDLPPEGYIAAARKDPVFARVEQRIANCTGIPVHPHEDIVSLSRLTSHGVSPRDGYFPPYGLHHDSHERPHRAWTVIVYLQAPETGGRTIFPLAGHQSDQRHREFASALQELFGGARKNYSRQALFDVQSDHPFMDLIEEGCRGENGLAFQPQPGSALLFPSDSRSFRTWHAGCNVINGTKIILQKFKEYPLPQRTDASAEIPYQSFAEPSLA
ncbi:unnamed protein product [Effrenium voratum]|nr:unnamed protein product [Effrenium voratum]